MPEFVRVHADVKTMFLPGQLQGLAGLRIHFDMKIGAGEFLIDSGADRPTLIPWLRAATGYVRSDGRLYDKPAVSAAPHDLDDPGELGVLVPADDPNFNLETVVAYHVSCEFPVAGREVVFKEWDITVPSSGSVDLGGITPGPALEVIGLPEFVSLDMVSGVGAAGKEVARSNTTVAALTSLGGSNSGRAVFMGTASVGRTALGLTEVGDALAIADNSGAARETLVVPSDYDDGLSDSRVPINGSVSAAKLDAALAAFYALVSAAVTSPYFQALVNGNVLNANNNTDATQKVAKFGVPHYTNAEEPVTGVRCESNAGSSLVAVGGGSSAMNAATEIQFYTAPNATTTTGTLRAYIDSNGAFTLANTAEQSTNYEKAVFRYNSNVLELGHLFAGTGTSARALKVGVAATAGGALARLLQIQNSAPFLTATWSDTTGAGSMVSVTGTCSATSGNQTALALTPTINQSSTAGYTGWLVNVIETAIGSGTNLLADLQRGGVSKFTVDRLGNVYGNRFRSEVTYRATAAGTTTLTKDSAGTQVFTGTSTQTCKLPTTGVLAGESTFISNQSTGDVTVQSSGANTIGVPLTTGQGYWYTALIDTPTTAAHWKAS